jgi:hypothetical protein
MIYQGLGNIFYKCLHRILHSILSSAESFAGACTGL